MQIDERMKQVTLFNIFSNVIGWLGHHLPISSILLISLFPKFVLFLLTRVRQNWILPYLHTLDFSILFYLFKGKKKLIQNCTCVICVSNFFNSINYVLKILLTKISGVITFQKKLNCEIFCS